MLIEIVREGAIAHVWLNRPEAHNALTPELGAALVEALATLEQDASCRIVVLEAADRRSAPAPTSRP